MVLIGIDGYSYNGKWFDIQDHLAAVASRIASIRER
jgi:hypothetical protein